ncbi:MAG: Ribonucleotide reductase of class Ia (aerobic), beta subunit, partial [uncultured Sphingomonas sp.]
CPSSKPASSTSRSNTPGRSNSGSASSRSTGCPRKCHWARTAATGRRSSPPTSATSSPKSSASSPRPTWRCRTATTTNTAACS